MFLRGNMEKRIITIYVDNNTTQNEITDIRNEFKKSEYYKNYCLNVIVSGNGDIKKTLEKFLLSTIKS